ncbi:hypothetical protein ACGFI3_25465 [Nonomuraea wenchangensis]|uniref:hypothetical protein n=1 Tax=Nonomuraea wenchangensis TaxID=568860 RepID=UPI003715E905
MRSPPVPRGHWGSVCPERLALLQQLTTAYLRSALTSGDLAWPDARAALESAPHSLGRIDGQQADQSACWVPTGST